MRIAVMGAVEDDFAAATTCTDEADVDPGVGEQTVTPAPAAEQPPPPFELPTVMLIEDLKKAPLESHACTTMKWPPEASVRLVFNEAA